jgi:ABC-type sugar transport system ATPase subunit
MSKVVFEGVTKRFDSVVAVDSLTLEVLDQEFMVLLGPSGCGKTTALRLIAGLDEITEGTLRIGDRVVNDVEAKDRNVSMVFQSYALYPHMTVAKNIESPLLARKFKVDGEVRKLTHDERAERIEEATGTLGLDELIGRKPAALSGGQRQRVALARAIVARPEVFLFDEPLSNLDAKLRAATRVDLVEMHQRLETTFIYVTHDQVEAMTMASRIAIITDGRLQQVGPPQAVYDRPHNLFVARFIGSPPMNTVEGRISIENGEPFALIGDGKVPLADLGVEPLANGTKVVVGVRPEHLSIGEGDVDARVRAVEWLGHERHILCDIVGTEAETLASTSAGVPGEPVAEAIIVRESAEGSAPSPGDVIPIGANPEHVHLFDPDTTERLN